MTLRILAALLAIAAVSASGTDAKAQDRGEAPKTESTPVPAEGEDAPKDASKDNEKDAKPKAPKIEKATFGGGCFWCTEAVFEQMKGVRSVVSGYSGGHVPNPTYQDVLTGLTGHAEVIQIEYDANEVPFEKLVRLFFASHDPTTPNAQGPDFGPQYRSIILFHSEDQKKVAQEVYRDLTAKKAFRRPIVTELVPFEAFFPAEEYHQDYYRKNPYADYVRAYITPKLKKLRGK